MFTTNQDNTIWFQPGSSEPLWKFEIIGLVFSLAVYNGVTLPACLPETYWQLLWKIAFPLGENNFCSDPDPWIQERFGTVLSLLDKEGDAVEEQRVPYAFTLRLGPGKCKDVDLKAFFSQGTSAFQLKKRERREFLPFLEEGKECPWVTAENRDDFVNQYMDWATRLSVLPESAAFSRGFLTCFERGVIDLRGGLDLLHPRLIRNVILGLDEIDLLQLKQHTEYEPRTDQHTVELFWSVVGEYSAEELRLLLKFVTACARVPIGGYAALGFTIATIEVSIDRLPTSSTCLRLLRLPKYPTQEMMREKLGLAIRWGQGFGLS